MPAPTDSDDIAPAGSSTTHVIAVGPAHGSSDDSAESADVTPSSSPREALWLDGKDATRQRVAPASHFRGSFAIDEGGGVVSASAFGPHDGTARLRRRSTVAGHAVDVDAGLITTAGDPGNFPADREGNLFGPNDSDNRAHYAPEKFNGGVLRF